LEDGEGGIHFWKINVYSFFEKNETHCMTISLIIPTLNEETRIRKLLLYLKDLPDQEWLEEIMVCDGGSEDRTLEEATVPGVQVLSAPARGRAIQMNYAAAQAQGSILYFVHADVFPPRTCFSDIQSALEAGHQMGCFQSKYTKESKMMQLNARFTHFNWMAVGGGDQTLFITRPAFDQLGGFDSSLPIMEDFDLVWRAQKHFPLHVVPKEALISARKYKNNSYLKVLLVNAAVFLLFRWGASPVMLSKVYKKYIK
jgi:rSAM/selenodomain-associated transferase 2